MEENKKNNQNEEYEVYDQWGTINNMSAMNTAMRAGYGAVDYSGYAEAEKTDERKYVLTILGCLMWGFFVNYLMCLLLAKPLLEMSSPVVFILFMPLQIASIIVRLKAKSSVAHFIAYNLLVLPLGLEISLIVGLAGAMEAMGAITTALLGTMIIMGVMFVMAYFKTEAFLSMGKALLIALFAAIVADMVVLLFFSSSAYVMIDLIFIVLFALYLGFDFSKAMSYPKTTENAVIAAYDVYYDLVILFVRLALIMLKSSVKRD